MFLIAITRERIKDKFRSFATEEAKRSEAFEPLVSLALKVFDEKQV